MFLDLREVWGRGGKRRTKRIQLNEVLFAVYKNVTIFDPGHHNSMYEGRGVEGREGKRKKAKINWKAT